MTEQTRPRRYYGTDLPLRSGPHPDPLADLLAKINLIIRDVAEIERDPLPGQADDEMRVTEAELRAILEDRLQ